VCEAFTNELQRLYFLSIDFAIKTANLSFYFSKAKLFSHFSAIENLDAFCNGFDLGMGRVKR
jgi:hypothetical protein